MSNFNNDSKKKSEEVADVVKYHLRATDEQVATLIAVWGLESVDDLQYLSEKEEKEILDQQIPILHFRRAVDKEWEIPPHLTFGKPEVPMESITIAPDAEVGPGVTIPINDLEFDNNYVDITVPDRNNPGERVIAEGRASYGGRSTSYKCMCDYQLSQAMIGALRILGITSLPSSPANSNDSFHLQKLLEVGEIPLSQNTSYMYKAQVTGKDVFFNILQRSAYPNPNDSSETSEEREYSVFKEYLTEMLPGGKFLKEYGGMSSPPNHAEQQDIIRYTGRGMSSRPDHTEQQNNIRHFLGKYVALYNIYYKGFISLYPDGIPRSLPWTKDPNALEKSSRTWERFQVVDGGNGLICLYNIHHKKFLRIQGDKVDTSSVRRDANDLPHSSRWPAERFQLVYHPGRDRGDPFGFAFHNPHYNRFIRLCNKEVDAKGGPKDSTSLPRNWTAEHFILIDHDFC
jgi:hypothetical protein